MVEVIVDEFEPRANPDVVVEAVRRQFRRDMGQLFQETILELQLVAGSHEIDGPKLCETTIDGQGLQPVADDLGAALEHHGRMASVVEAFGEGHRRDRLRDMVEQHVHLAHVPLAQGLRRLQIEDLIEFSRAWRG